MAVLCLLAIYPCSLVMPSNKKIFSLTFLFCVLSTSATILTLLLIIIDYVPQAIGSQSKAVYYITRPFTWLGMNPLAIFIMLQLLFDVLNNWITVGDSTPYLIFYKAAFSWMGNGIGTAIYALFYGVIYAIAAGLLYRAKIFIRLWLIEYKILLVNKVYENHSPKLKCLKKSASKPPQSKRMTDALSSFSITIYASSFSLLPW